MDKQNVLYIHVVEYLALQRKKVRLHATTQMYLAQENNPVTKKTHTVCFYLGEVAGVVRSIATERRMVVARGWEGRGMGSYCSAGREFQLYKMRILVLQ